MGRERIDVVQSRMNRYADITSLARSVLALIQPHSSLRPISLGELLRAHPDDSADIPNALQNLIDARLITSMRHTVGDTTQTVFWPTGLKPITAHPATEAIKIMSEPKNSMLNRLILLHGPIAGTALAEKAREQGANIPAKNVPGLLETLIRKGEVIARKRDGATWYMTPMMADTEDAAHVMSAPVSATASTAPEEGVTCAHDEIAELKTRIHDLLNDAAGANMLLQHLAKKLSVEKFEDIPGAFDELTQALAARAMQPEPAAGRLALLLIDSADLTELEELDQHDAPNAQQLAVRTIEQGHAARAVVIRILGEARRRVEWKEAA